MGEGEAGKGKPKWHKEVAKFQLQKRVSRLIETFDGSREGSAEPQQHGDGGGGDGGGGSLAELKQRRGSLQTLNVDTVEAEQGRETRRLVSKKSTINPVAMKFFSRHFLY